MNSAQWAWNAAAPMPVSNATRTTAAVADDASSHSTATTSSSSSTDNIIKWKIRPVKPSDKKALTKIMKRSFSTSLRRDYNKQTLRQALPLISKPRNDLLNCSTWFVAVHPKTGKVVGCGGWTNETPNNTSAEAAAEGQDSSHTSATSTPHLRHFATDPKWSRQGIGRALWDRIWEEEVCNDKVLGPTTTIEVYSTLTAEPFYSSLGFVPVQRTTVPLTRECNFPCTLMRRTPLSSLSSSSNHSEQ